MLKPKLTSIGLDLSLNATGICVMCDGRPAVIETLHFKSHMGFERHYRVLKRVDGLITEYQPQVIQIEDYAGGSNMNSMIPNIELGGAIRVQLWERNFIEGYDGLTTKWGYRVVAPTTMKKFCLGRGDVKKGKAGTPEMRTYMETVMARLGQSFEDDNQADAYMHAMMAGITRCVVRGEVPISNLPECQQLVLMSEGIKRRKGLSENKALKLTDAEKMQLVIT